VGGKTGKKKKANSLVKKGIWEEVGTRKSKPASLQGDLEGEAIN